MEDLRQSVKLFCVEISLLWFYLDEELPLLVKKLPLDGGKTQQHGFIKRKPKYGFEFQHPSSPSASSSLNKLDNCTLDTVPATESNINRNSNVAAKLVNVAELELAKKKTEECKTNLLKNGIIHHMCELISKWLFGQLWRKERLKCVSS